MSGTEVAAPFTVTSRTASGLLLALMSSSVLLAASSAAFGQDARPVPVLQPFLRNTTRFEAWRYFDPPPPTPAFTPGDPTTDHLGNRLLAGLRIRRGRLDATAAVQYVQFGGLPVRAIGPGALGTGALYFDHSGDAASHQVYLKAAHVAMRQLGKRMDVQIGRMAVYQRCGTPVRRSQDRSRKTPAARLATGG